MTPARRPLCAVLLCAATALCCTACADKEPVRYAMPPTALAVDGPPLALAGEYAGVRLTGQMDRGCMAGYGTVYLQSDAPLPVDAEYTNTTGNDDPSVPREPLVCRAEIDAPPSIKSRVHATLVCTGDIQFRLALRNLGPDQGLGIAKHDDDPAIMVLFYHPSAEEAERRLADVKHDIIRLRQERGLPTAGLDGTPRPVGLGQPVFSTQ